MSIMPNFSQSGPRFGDAMRAAAESRRQPEKLRVASPGAERVPLYSQGKLSAFVRRTRLAETKFPLEARDDPGDPGIERAIAIRWEMEAGTSAAHLGISAIGGIVRLSGSVETVHDRMALCRIAAAINETVAIIDELWVNCE